MTADLLLSGRVPRQRSNRSTLLRSNPFAGLSVVWYILWERQHDGSYAGM